VWVRIVCEGGRDPAAGGQMGSRGGVYRTWGFLQLKITHFKRILIQIFVWKHVLITAKCDDVT